MNENELIAKLDVLADYKAQADLLAIEKKQLLEAAMPTEVRQRMEEIEAEFSDKGKAVSENSSALEAEIKKAVVELGASVKGHYLHAVYAKGRVTWDSKTLDKFIVQYPEIGVARNEGEPSVSLRAVK
jgi:hypothetical protein